MKKLMALGIVCCLFIGCGRMLYSGHAAEWYSLAKKGDAEAMLSLAKACLTGTDGAEMNSKDAVEWYKKAAETGNGRAEGIYAMMFWYGFHVPHDTTMFEFWYRKSAEQNQMLPQIFGGLKQAATRSLNYADLHDGMTPSKPEDLSSDGETIPDELRSSFTFYPTKLADAGTNTVIALFKDLQWPECYTLITSDSRLVGAAGATPEIAASKNGFVIPKVL